MSKKFPDQTERIGAALERSGLTYEQMAEMVGVKPESLRKVWKGYQVASEQLLRSIDTAANAEAGSPRSILRRALRDAGMTPSQLAKKVKRDAGVIEAVVNGSARASEAMIEQFVQVFPSLSKEELMAGSDHPKVIREDGLEGTYGAKPPKIDGLPAGSWYVPLLSWAQAGALAAGWGDGDAGYDQTAVLATGIKDRRAFAVTIKGDSMTPEIKEGDCAIVCPQEPLRAGSTVIVRTVDGDVMCKVYQPKGKTGVTFVSVNNAKHPPIEFSLSDIAWIYPVKQVLRNY